MRENGMTEDENKATIQLEASNRVPDLLTMRYLGENILYMNTDKVKLTTYTL
jgi:hypothetical protein